MEALLDDLKKKALETPKGEWIRAWGFNETAVKEKRYPTIAELDAISVEHPIIIYSYLPPYKCGEQQSIRNCAN